LFCAQVRLWFLSNKLRIGKLKLVMGSVGKLKLPFHLWSAALVSMCARPSGLIWLMSWF